jgi:hypothetical protein
MFSTTPLNADQTTAVLIVSLITMAAAVISVTGILMGVWGTVMNRRSEAALKSEMIGRGMSAEEIVEVIAIRSDGQPRFAGPRGGIGDLHHACEAVVEWGGDWHPALVLGATDSAFLVHYVGNTMDENEWVAPSRIRFPANSPLRATSSLWPSATNGVPRKAPMEQEV